MHAIRLTAADRDVARTLFALLVEVFEEAPAPLSDGYLDRVLGNPAFWAIAAMDGGDVVGGLTAHTLLMTKSESTEVFLYDLAVRADRQRQGVGRMLVAHLLAGARAEGVDAVFVPADAEDAHALDFYRALDTKEAAVHFFTFAGASTV